MRTWFLGKTEEQKNMFFLRQKNIRTCFFKRHENGRTWGFKDRRTEEHGFLKTGEHENMFF